MQPLGNETYDRIREVAVGEGLTKSIIIQSRFLTSSFFFNLFIKPSLRIHMFFQMRRCDI